MGDLNSRRGRVQGMESKGRTTVINAQVPMAEMLTYGTMLTSMTQGKGSYRMEMDHYDIADKIPQLVADKILANAKRPGGGRGRVILTLSPEEVKVHAASTYEFFRKNRCTRRTTRTTRWGIATDGHIEPEGLEESWHEHYSEIVGSFGAGISETSKSISTNSLFGKLADPDYSIYDEMIENQKIEKEQMEARMSVANTTQKGGVSDNKIELIVFFAVIIGIAIILSLIGNR
jgi:hypothetical protein